MARYSALYEHPMKDERVIRPSEHQYRSQCKPASNNYNNNISLEQESEIEHGSATELSSLVDNVETSLRPSLDLSTLSAAGLLGGGPKQSASTPIRLIVPSSEHRDGLCQKKSDNTFNSPESRLHTQNGIDPGFPASKYVSTNHSRRKLWNPIWLTKFVIGTFSVLFLGIFFVVLALYLYSEAHNGLLNGSEDLHYAWTYLPTAVFVLAASLWRQVDFYCKELTPYRKMRQGPTPAEQSIFLDYIDPFFTTSFWRALKYRHWAVIASLTIYQMLKFCTVLSAGLLILAPVRITEATDSLVSLTNFDATNLDLTDVAADLVDAFYGAKTRGLPWTYSTTESLTVQTFDFNGSDSLPNAILTAEVPGISVAMECELATIAAGSSWFSRPWESGGILGEYLLGNISGTDCDLIGISLGQTPSDMFFNIVNKTAGYKTNYQGIFNYYVCNGGFDYGYDGIQSPPNAESDDDYRFLLTMSEVSWYSTSNDSIDDISATNWTIARSTGVLCKPSYNVDNYSVTLIPYNQTLQEAKIIPNTSTNLFGFDLKDLLDGIVNALSSSTFGQGGDDYIIVPVPLMFELLASLNNNSRQEAVIEPNLLQNLSTQALQGIGDTICPAIP